MSDPIPPPAPEPAMPPVASAPSAPVPPRPPRPTAPFRGMGGLKNKRVPTPAAPPGAPAGWWSIQNIKGAKADVAAAVAKIVGIPAHHAAALQTEILGHDAGAVTVNAHFSQENRRNKTNPSGPTSKGKLVLHLDITPIDGFVGAGGS